MVVAKVCNYHGADLRVASSTVVHAITTRSRIPPEDILLLPYCISGVMEYCSIVNFTKYCSMSLIKFVFLIMWYITYPIFVSSRYITFECDQLEKLGNNKHNRTS